jgi:hypothetical protein
MRSIASPLDGFRSPFGARSALAAFDPASLFAASEQGAWYDPSDLSTVWADTAGTIPASVNGTVARIDDKSGNGHHATQATAAARPILRLDATTGTHYLETDGVDDRLQMALAISTDYDRTTVLRQISWTLNDQVYGNGTSGSAELRQRSVSPSLGSINNGTTPDNTDLAIGVTGLVTERYHATGSTVSVQINDGTAATSAVTTTIVAPADLGIGARTGGTLAGNFRIYEIVMRYRMTTEQLAALKAYYYAKHGITP